MKFQTLVLACILVFSTLYGAVEDHFKKAINKEGDHQIPNIDFIYMINLDQRPQKYSKSIEQLAPYGINPYRFSAVNGWELSLEDVNDLGVKYESWMEKGLWGTYFPLDGEGKSCHEIMHVEGRIYFCHCMVLGAIGIALSHLSILQDAFDSGYETVWIMEDDIQIIKNPHIMSYRIDTLDRTVGKDWDILFTDRDTKNQQGEYVTCTTFSQRPNFSPWNPERFAQRKRIGRELRRVGARFGAYSYIIRRSGMEKLLNHFKANKIFLPYDMEFYLPSDIKMYTVFSDIVSTIPNALSDNGKPYYLNP